MCGCTIIWPLAPSPFVRHLAYFIILVEFGIQAIGITIKGANDFVWHPISFTLATQKPLPPQGLFISSVTPINQ